MHFLVGIQYIQKINVNDGEQRQLVDNIFKQSSTSSTVPYFVGIAEFLTNVIPLICRSFSLMMKWYSVESTVTKSVDVEMTRHGFSPPGEMTDTDSIDNTNTEIITVFFLLNVIHKNILIYLIKHWKRIHFLV